MAFSLAVSPIYQDLAFFAGETYSNTVEFINISADPLSFDVSAVPYSVFGEDYEPDFYSTSRFTEIVNWITFPQTHYDLEPGAKALVDYTINAPVDAASGGQYAAIMATASNPVNPESNIQIIGSVGMPLYARVNGLVVESGELLNQSLPFFAPGTSFSALATFNNTGNIDYTVSSTLTVTNLSGRTLYDNSEFPETLHILPETTRLIKSTASDLPAIGIYNATYTINYLNQSSTIATIIVACPFWLVIVIVAIFTAIIAFIIYQIFTHRSKKRKNRPL